MSVALGIGCAAVGAAAGPFLAGLTLRVPAGAGVFPRDRADRAPELVAGPRRTLVVTVLAALVLGGFGAAIGAEPELLAFLWLGLVAVPLAVIDVETFRLPDRLVYPGFVVGLALLAGASRAAGDWSALGRAILAAAVSGAFWFLFALLFGDSGLGLGDVKLLALLGLFLGWLSWWHVALGVASGFLVGALVAVVLLAARRAGWKDHIPFGQWLIAGAVLAVVTGGPVLDAYLGIGT